MISIERAPRRYQFELAAAFLMYFATLFGRIPALEAVHDPVLVTIIKLSPILPILLMALAVWRFYRRMDEFHRIRMLKVAAISGGLTGIAASSWSFLADIGAPPLTNFGAFFILAGAFALVNFLFRVEDAKADGKLGRLTRMLSWASTFVLVASSLWYVVAFFSGQPWTIALVVAGAAAVVYVCVSLRLGPSTGIM